MLAGAPSGAPKDNFKYGPSLKPAPVLTWERTVEENAPALKAEMEARAAASAAKKVPPPKQVLNPKGVKHILDMVYDPNRRTLDDNYARSISKSYNQEEENKKKRQAANKKKGKQVPQLGEQKAQSLAPLKVQTDKGSNIEKNIGAAGDYLDDDAFDAMFPETHEIARQFVYGEDLLPPGEIVRLAYQMRKLHDWYKKSTKNGLLVFYVTYRADQFFINNEICVEFEELWQL